MNKDVKHSMFGNELMMLYGRVNLSQGEFAHLVGISSVALRRWESGASCPKAESLKRALAILISKGAFSKGEEETEVIHLWELANERGLKVPFDEVWFRAVMQGQAEAATGDTAVGIVPGADPNLPTDHGNEENLTCPATSSDAGNAHRTIPHLSRDLAFTPDKGRRRRKWLLAILIVLVILTIIGAAGALFFYTRDHATDQAYPGYLSGKGTLVFFDPLSRERGSAWASSSLKDYGGACQFFGGAYHVSQQTNTSFQSCSTRRTFSDFAFEVQLTIIQGDCGGMVFRMESPAHFYFFCICQNGTSYIRKYVSDSGSDFQTLYQKIRSVVHTGPGHQNKIAVVASGCMMTFYVNEQQIDQEKDSSYTLGKIALIARLYQNGGHATDVAYRNAKLWTL